ncbi:TPA: hypothetical protein ACH3X1_012231 [Trebouxia sp. C0004]
MTSRSRAKSRDDIMALMHVAYTGKDALPLQQDTDLMTAQDIWARKYHELWEKLEKNTRDSFCTALWKWLAWCDRKGLDTVIHPITKCVIFLEDLLSDMVAKNSKDPFGTVRVARKALSKIRELQRGVPPPYGEAFSKETLIRSASSKALAATTEARIGPDSDPLRDGFQATSLDQDEVERILDACIKHNDHWSGFRVAAMVLLGTAMGFRGDDLMDAKPSLLALTPVVRSTPVPMQPVTCSLRIGKVNSFGWLRYSGFGRHKEPHLDAAGALADLLVFTLNLTGLDILQKIESQDTTWWQYRLLFRDLYHADKKQDRNALAKPLQNILQEVDGSPVVKTKVLHLFRDSGVILLASGGAGSELLSIWGHWARGTLQQAYLEKNPLSALVAFAIAGGWDQTSFMGRHFCGRALVMVPERWIDSLFPGVRKVLDAVRARNARLQSGKRQADDRVSDRAAEGFLQTVLYSGICFWQNLPFRTQRYGLAYALHRLPAVAAIIATQEYHDFAREVIASHDKANKQAELDVSASMGEMLTDMQAPALYDTSGSIRTVAFAWKEWKCGPGEATIADRVSLIKADKSLAVGARNSSLHKKNRHLPQLIEMLVNLGATLLESIRLMTQIADHFDLTLDQMREGARLLNGKAAKPDCTALTAETNVTVGHFRQGIAWAQGEIRKNQQEQSVVAN